MFVDSLLEMQESNTSMQQFNTRAEETPETFSSRWLKQRRFDTLYSDKTKSPAATWNLSVWGTRTHPALFLSHPHSKKQIKPILKPQCQCNLNILEGSDPRAAAAVIKSIRCERSEPAVSLCSSALCYHVQPEVEQKWNRDRRAHIWNVLERHEEQREAEGEGKRNTEKCKATRGI